MTRAGWGFLMNHPARLALIALATAAPLAAQTAIPTGTARYDANAPGSYVLAEGVTRSVASGGNEVIRIADSGTAGAYSFEIHGSVIQSGSGRGIRTGTGTAANVSILIGATGFVRGTSDDAIQGRGGPFSLINLGTLYSGSNIAAETPVSVVQTGRGLNLRDATEGGTIVNGSETNSTALIRADGADAVRVGSGFAFINYGTILGNGRVNDNSANNIFSGGSTATTFQASDGFSFEDQDAPGPGATNSSLDNHGLVSGARHGVEAGERGSNLTVTNRAGGQIIGRNGSGVGFDSLETDATKIVVNNHGLIRGDYAGVGNVIDRTGNLSATHDGDGDGIDIDGAATINNHVGGQIISTGAGGFDSSGRANNSEAISIGGGVIVNDGLIRGANRGILVNNDSNADGSRGGYVATTITNNATGTIEGQDGFAIRLENKYGDARDNDTIVNHGTIIGTGAIPDPDAIVLRQDGLADPNSTGTLDGVVYTGEGLARFIRGDGSAIQMGEGDDVLTNTGTITGANGRAINMEGGNDVVTFLGGTITGDIDGGAGTDTLNLGEGVASGSAIKRFEQVNVAAGTATLSGVVSGTTLNKGGAGTLVVTAANETTGLVTVEQGTLVVNNTTGSGTGSGNVFVDTGAILAGDGFIAGDVELSGILAPGNSIGTLEVGGDVTWNGGAENAWQFELGLDDVSDRLLIGGDFLKGAGVEFVFDFLSGATTGEFVLVQWDGTTDFVAGDFSYVNLGGGLTGAFAIEGNQLVFSAVPEPATYASLFGAGVLGFALLRRRHLRG